MPPGVYTLTLTLTDAKNPARVFAAQWKVQAKTDAPTRVIRNYTHRFVKSDFRATRSCRVMAKSPGVRIECSEPAGKPIRPGSSVTWKCVFKGVVPSGFASSHGTITAQTPFGTYVNGKRLSPKLSISGSNVVVSGTWHAPLIKGGQPNYREVTFADKCSLTLIWLTP